MKELALTLAGLWFYAFIFALAFPFIGERWGAFLIGYLVVSAVDLWRCWRSTSWRRVRPTMLELSLAVFIIFPFGSLLWLPWDAARVLNRA